MVENVGTAGLNISGSSLTGVNAGEFNITGGGGAVTVAPGGTHNIDVDFNPTTLGSKSAALSISSDDPDENPLDVSLSGNGVAVPVPDISVTPTSHDYGDVQLGSSGSNSTLRTCRSEQKDLRLYYR